MKNHRGYIDYIRNLSRMQQKPEKIQRFELIPPLNCASVNSTCALGNVFSLQTVDVSPLIGCAIQTSYLLFIYPRRLQ